MKSPPKRPARRKIPLDDAVCGARARSIRHQCIDQQTRHGNPRLPGRTTNVREEEGVRKFQIGRIYARLVVEHVEPGGEDSAIPQHSNQVCVNNEIPSSNVDENELGRGYSERFGGDEPACLRDRWPSEQQDIAVGDKLNRIVVETPLVLSQPPTIVVGNLHTKRTRTNSHAPPNISHAENSERPPRKANAKELAGRPALPMSPPEKRDAFGDPSRRT